jgi:SRSO17 transposase
MDVEELRSLRTELGRYLRSFKGCVKTAASRRHFRTYLEGQLGDLERKNVASIALEARVPPRTLQEFLELHRWDHQQARQRHQRRVVQQHPSREALAVVDETGFAKKGDKTAGVQRQYCGATGKTDNCTVSVHLGYVAEDFHTLVDSDLYLPESWLADRERCRQAGIPHSVEFRPKWRIALDLLDRAAAHGIRYKYLTADEEYGSCTAFRNGVHSREILYVVEVRCSTVGWSKRQGVNRAPQRVERLGCVLLRYRGQFFHVKNTDKGPAVWEAAATRFSPSEEKHPAPEAWLIVARNALDQEVKYFLSNAPSQMPLKRMLKIAFGRAEIEQMFKESKGQIGLDHFEVRHYQPLIRHLILSMLSLTFLVEQTARLRGGKPPLDAAAGPLERGGPIRPHDESCRAKASSPGRAPTGPVLAAVQRTRQAQPLRTAPRTTQNAGHSSIPTDQVLQLLVAL